MPPPLDRRRFLAHAALGGAIFARGFARAAGASAAAERIEAPVVDEVTWHEHATCFRLGDRGLVVVTSRGHAGIVNTPRRAQSVTGIDKIHALVGGFHLVPAPDDCLGRVMAELKTFDMEHAPPMHDGGDNFIALAKPQIPEKLAPRGAGGSFTFTA